MTRFFSLRLVFALAAAALLAAGVGGCASERRSTLGHAYDNVVARDNAYFLAREKLRTVEATLRKERQNDYNRVLPLFPKLDEATVAKISADLEDVVKKASIPIQYRPGSDWTDDAYVLIGKTRYYKMEFEDAAKTFKYVNSTSKDRNARHEALIWLMRTFVATKELENAKSVSDLLDKEEGLEANARELFLTRADYYLHVGEPAKAIEQLERAVPLVEPKNEQSRTRYILAQLYQAQGDDKKAYAELNRILKKNPPYELDFFSKLMLGQVSDLNTTDRARLDKYFAKLLKDNKNKEYRDKIYYEMARLEYRQKRYPEALQLLEKSVRANNANRAQKAYTYLLAGRIYYENLQKYRLAAAYYDSTVQSLPKEAAEYAATAERAAILKDFAQQITTIETQDSLQALARLDTVTLRARLVAYADAELTAQRKAAEALAAKQERDAARQQQAALGGISNARDLQTDVSTDDFLNGNAGPKWYFDNPTALSTARADFIRRWGDRPLQDNWRTVSVASSSPVTNRGGNVPVSVAGANQTNVTAGATTNLGRATADPATQQRELVAKYRQALPLTPAQMAASNKQVEDALFALGNIYNQQLREPLPAAQTFEKLTARFPASSHLPETYYSLYLIYKEQNELAKAELYAQRLRQEFPNSQFARLAADPEYLRRTSVANSQVAARVDSAFALYKNQEFKKASAVLARTSKKFPESDLNDRVAYLNALIALRTQPPATAKNALEKFAKDYAQSPLGNDARTLLGSYKKYEAGEITGALASTQKPSVSMFRPGEVNNRLRIFYAENESPAAPLLPAPLVKTPAPAKDAPVKQPDLAGTPAPAPSAQPSPAPTAAPTTDAAAAPAATPAVDPVKAARMAAAQARARGKKPPKTAPIAAPAAAGVAATTPAAPTADGPGAAPTAAAPPVPASPYAAQPISPDTKHAVVLMFAKGAEVLYELPEQLATYHGRYFRAANLQIQQKPFNDAFELVVVQGLTGAKAAQAYTTKLRGPQSPLAKLRGAGYQTLVVADANLPLLLQRHDAEEYQRFYQQAYGGKSVAAATTAAKAPSNPTPPAAAPAATAPTAAPPAAPSAAAPTKAAPTKPAPAANSAATTPVTPAPAPAAASPSASQPATPAPAAPVTAAPAPAAPASPYAGQPANLNASHAVVLVFPRGAEPLFTVPEQLGTYNGRYFRAANLKIEQKPFSQTSELVVVQGLAGAKAAQAYATKLRGPQSPLAKLRGAGYQTLVVSIDNLPLLLQRHDVDEYLRFYQQTYTK